ncbi:RICIN domain-containing protein [Lentzea sp. NPDC051838]|uniref:RICIN domain-containing protein n=1 Tax=Lentzea sp. NPDC051838 TaxID=3154849 RepID=UPI0034206AAC
MFKKVMIAAAAIAMTLSGSALASAQDQTANAGIAPFAVEGPFTLHVGFAPYRNLEALRTEINQNGGHIRQWSNDGTDEQKWLFFSDSTIRPVLNTSMCLDANPNQPWNGGQVYVWGCHGGAPQQWRESPGLPGTLRNAATQRCLDANPNENFNGGTIYQWECYGGVAQQWTKVRVG